MITLITGLPGNGKTLYALAYTQKHALSEGRQVWYHGIADVSPALGWKKCPTVLEHIDGDKNPAVEVPQWWLLPAKSIIVIDEVQNCGFAPRQRGARPDWSSKLETHRHLGVDLVMITQDPGLIDSHDRKLCELHFHVMRTFGMQRAVVHEFRPVRMNVLSSRKGSIEHRWPFPKEVFGWYKSAEAHTHKRRIPAKVFIFLALPFVVAALSWWAWSQYLSPNRDSLKKPAAVQAKAPGGAGQQGQSVAKKMTASEYVAQFQPRVPDLLHSAPAYDEVTKPTRAPYPAACISMGSRCDCYTQQGTKLQVAKPFCEQVVAGGFFLGWDEKPAPVQVTAQVAPKAPETPPPAPAWISLGGTVARSAESSAPADAAASPSPGRSGRQTVPK